MAEFAVLQTERGVDDAMVDAELRAVWTRLRTEGLLRRDAAEAGVDAATLVATAASPFAASRNEAQFGVAETILISVAGGLAKDVVQRLWVAVVWPALKKKFPALETALSASSGPGADRGLAG